MHRSKRLRSCSLASLLVVCLVGMPVTLAADTDGTQSTADLSTIKGKLMASDGSPLVGATVKLFHLSTEQTFEATSRGNGSFEAAGLPYGYFDIAIESGSEFFVTNSVVNLPPSDTLNVDLKLASPGTLAPDRSFPGVDKAATGTAIVSGNVTATNFWTSPKGIAVLAGGGGALLLLVSGGSSSASASTP